MSHLTEERVFQIALGDERSVVERDHLTVCASCVQALHDERALTRMLVEMELPEPPAHFVAEATRRFDTVRPRPELALIAIVVAIPVLGGAAWALGLGAWLAVVAIQLIEGLQQALALFDGVKVLVTPGAAIWWGGMVSMFWIAVAGFATVLTYGLRRREIFAVGTRTLNKM